MKKQLMALATIATLTLGISGQVSAHSYTVKSGDTLYSISKNENVSVQSIKTLNGLSSNLIKPNQNLKITDDKIEQKIHTVKSGDTLYSIARNNNISLQELVKINELTSTIIHPGDKLTLSGSATPAPVKAPVVQKAPQPSTPQPSTPQPSTPQPTTASTNVVREFTVSATAYTASCKGCSGITKTGINLLKNPHLKVIAVDPTVIPLGSKVWVEGYGEAIAGDVGSAIKNNKIDVSLPSQADAIKWGRKNVTIKILN